MALSLVPGSSSPVVTASSRMWRVSSPRYIPLQHTRIDWGTITFNIPDELLIDLLALVPAAGVHTQVPPGADKVETKHTNN